MHVEEKNSGVGEPTAREDGGSKERSLANSLPWWSPACQAALLLLQSAPSHECQHVRVVLRFTIRDAKRSYFENLLSDPDADLWHLAS